MFPHDYMPSSYLMATNALSVLNLAGISSVLGLLYGLPMILLTQRKGNNFSTVFVLNIIFGWTVIGWLIALVLVLTQKNTPPLQETFPNTGADT